MPTKYNKQSPFYVRWIQHYLISSNFKYIFSIILFIYNYIIYYIIYFMFVVAWPFQDFRKFGAVTAHKMLEHSVRVTTSNNSKTNSMFK